MGQTATLTHPDCPRREGSWRIYLIARVSSELGVAFKSAHCGQFQSRNYPCWCLLLACHHQGCKLMRQSPDDQIVRIESELREETLHSSTVREAPGMSEAPHACVTAFTTVPSPVPTRHGSLHFSLFGGWTTFATGVLPLRLPPHTFP